MVYKARGSCAHCSCMPLSFLILFCFAKSLHPDYYFFSFRIFSSSQMIPPPIMQIDRMIPQSPLRKERAPLRAALITPKQTATSIAGSPHFYVTYGLYHADAAYTSNCQILKITGKAVSFHKTGPEFLSACPKKIQIFPLQSPLKSDIIC